MPGPGWGPRWSGPPWPALPLRPAQSRLSPPASLRHGDGSVPPATWSLGLGPRLADGKWSCRHPWEERRQGSWSGLWWLLSSTRSLL